MYSVFNTALYAVSGRHPRHHHEGTRWQCTELEEDREIPRAGARARALAGSMRRVRRNVCLSLLLVADLPDLSPNTQKRPRRNTSYPATPGGGIASIDLVLASCKSDRVIVGRCAVDACGNRAAVSKDLWTRAVSASKRSGRSGSIHNASALRFGSFRAPLAGSAAPGWSRSDDRQRVHVQGPPGSGARGRDHDAFLVSSVGSPRRARWCRR